MFLAILLTVLALLGIPASIFVVSGGLYVWANARSAGWGGLVAIVAVAIGLIVLWCLLVAEAVERWIAIFN